MQQYKFWNRINQIELSTAILTEKFVFIFMKCVASISIYISVRFFYILKMKTSSTGKRILNSKRIGYFALNQFRNKIFRINGFLYNILNGMV